MRNAAERTQFWSLINWKNLPAFIEVMEDEEDGHIPNPLLQIVVIIAWQGKPINNMKMHSFWGIVTF